MRRGCKSCDFFSLKKRRLGKDLLNVKYLKGGRIEDGARLSEVMSRDGMQWAQTETRKGLSEHQEMLLFFF